MKTQQLLTEGLLGLPDAAVQVRELLGDPNSSGGGRAIAVSLAGGLSFEVLIERGLDIGSAWANGQPLAWRAPMNNPGLAPTPSDWLGRFGGGLLTTCGLDNIGGPRGKYGQHGSHHDTRAAEVSWSRLAGSENQAPGVIIRGVVDSIETFGRTVRLYREIEARCDEPGLIVRDRIVNEGRQAAPVAILYHFNFGAPLVLPGSRVEVAASSHVAREVVPGIPDWESYPQPLDELTESVWIHRGLDVHSGFARASVTSPEGRRLDLEWTAETLPSLVQWVFPSRGRWALGVEPGNAPIFGPEREAEGAGVPVLGVGEEWRYEVRLRVS